MSKCEKVDKCPFFNGLMACMPEEIEKIKKDFCLGNYMSCARFIVSKNVGAEHVPGDMFPNDTYEATRILRIMTTNIV